MNGEKRRAARKAVQRALQAQGLVRSEARKVAFEQGSSEPTRRAVLAQRVGENAARKRWRKRRAQAIAASVATAEAAY